MPELEPGAPTELEPETEDGPFTGTGPELAAEHPQVPAPAPEPEPEPEPGLASRPEPVVQETEDESPGHECGDPTCLDCGGPQPAPPLHECADCGREFKSGHGLKIHVGRAHNGSGGES